VKEAAVGMALAGWGLLEEAGGESRPADRPLPRPDTPLFACDCCRNSAFFCSSSMA